MLVTGIGLGEPRPSFDIAPYLSFSPIGTANARSVEAQTTVLPAMDPEPEALTFVRSESVDSSESVDPDAIFLPSLREASLGHGRFAAPGNAVRRQVQLRAISPRTADELAGFFREASYTLDDVRLGEAVPPIKVDRVPADLGSKDGNERKALFITAILPVVLGVNQRVLSDREQLLHLRDRLESDEPFLTPFERIWLDVLAERYETTVDQLDELVRRVDVVPPSMAIAQGGVESGWGTSYAARTGNALFGQIQATGRHSVSVPWKPGRSMPQPFSSVGEATEAYIANLNTHPAYAGFRQVRAQMREHGELLEGYRLIGTLLRYSERGAQYVQFVRQIMRENELSDFDGARLSDL